MSETQTLTISEGPSQAIELVELKGDTGRTLSPSPAAQIVDAEAVKKRGNLKLSTIVLALNLALFVGALNDTVLANAIPVITKEFDSATGYVWIAAAHSLPKAATGPLWAKFSDIWGRKPILLSALAIFFVGSCIAGWSTGIEILIAGRVIQGIGGGGMFGLIMIVVSDIFSVRTRTLFFGLMALVWAVAGAIGPIAGGALTQLASWRWCFWINLPTSGVAFLLILGFLDVHNPRTKISDGLRAIDWLGSLFILGMILMILLGLDFGGVIFPWSSPKVVCLIVAGALCSVFLYASERWVAKYPIVPLHLFKNRANVACLLVAAMQSFTFIGAEYYLPLYFQSVQEASPLRSGVLTVPLTIAEALAAIASGLIIHRIGRYQELMWLAALMMTIGNGLYINLGVTSSVAAVAIPQIVAGLGVGCLFDPPLIALHANIPQKDVAAASAAIGTAGGIASAISIVGGGVIFQNSMFSQRTQLEKAGLTPDLVDRIAGTAAAAHVDEIALIQDASQRLAAKNAVVSSMRNMWIMYTSAAFLCLAASLLIKKNVLSKEHTETKTGLKKDD